MQVRKRLRSWLVGAALLSLGLAVAPASVAEATPSARADIGTAHASLGSVADVTGTEIIGTDYNGDGRTDIALTGGTGWGSLPVAFSQGDGSFTVTNVPINGFATFATEPGAKIVSGDFNGDGRTDVALTGGTGWGSLPVAFSQGDGSFTVTNVPIDGFATFATEPGAKIVTGDFNHDGRTDIALTGGTGWGSLPVAFSQGDGSFTVTNVPIDGFATFATEPGAKIVAGDFNHDGRTDIALTGGTGWGSLPVAFSQGDGSFTVTNTLIDGFATFATQPGATVVSTPAMSAR
jgi:hypothetical protein